MEAKDYAVLFAMHAIGPDHKEFYDTERLRHFENMLLRDTAEAFKRVALFQITASLEALTDNKPLSHNLKDTFLATKDYSKAHKILYTYAIGLEKEIGSALLEGLVDRDEVHSLHALINRLGPSNLPRMMHANLGKGATQILYRITYDTAYHTKLTQENPSLDSKKPVVGYIKIKNPRKKPKIKRFLEDYRKRQKSFKPAYALVGEGDADTWRSWIDLEMELARQRAIRE